MSPEPSVSAGPVLLAYDGSVLAELAIAEAARQLAPGREALAVCVWQPADVGFLPVGEKELNAADATEVRQAAAETAAHGAALAEQAGFRSQGIAVEAAPTWRGILDAAAEHEAGVIVLGSHRRTGIVGHLLGSVAAAVSARSACAVLIVHARSESDERG